ncbi:MAG: hypothetical protein M0R40_08745, partial [Firmicutes bacterium]|nr:hypothetical protein [Bacillota bacterium]
FARFLGGALLFPPEKLTRFVIAPLPQKATFASAKRLQARAFYADLLTTTFLRSVVFGAIVRLPFLLNTDTDR